MIIINIILNMIKNKQKTENIILLLCIVKENINKKTSKAKEIVKTVRKLICSKDASYIIIIKKNFNKLCT